MPDDRNAVYMADGQGQLTALPVEQGHTPINAIQVAGGNKKSYVEIPGERAPIGISSSEPRLYVFFKDGPEGHPPFLVLLTPRKGARRVTAFTEKGRSGYAIATEEIVKPHYRVLGKEGGLVFMEIRPRNPLIPGEYAIIGNDLSRIATFRVS
jgi:hypothetical protein